MKTKQTSTNEVTVHKFFDAFGDKFWVMINYEYMAEHKHSKPLNSVLYN